MDLEKILDIYILPHLKEIKHKRVEKLTVVRVEKSKNYVTMNRTALNDKRLSWKAKGIIAYMLSMPDDWTFYMTELTKHSTDGEKAFRSGLKELKEFGYVKRNPIRENNKIVGWETIVMEAPQTLDNTLLADFVHVENVLVGNVHVQKDELLSTDIELSTDNTNCANNESDFEKFWSIYPRRLDKKRALKSFNACIKRHPIETIIAGTEKYAKQVQHTEAKFIKHPSTFLNNDSFIDGFEEVEQPTTPKKPVVEEKSVLADMWGDDF